MPLTRRDHQGSALTTSFATIFTFNSGLATVGGVLSTLTLVNDGTSLRTVRIELIESGGSAAQAKLIAKVQIGAGDSIVIAGPWFAASSAFVQAKQDVGTDCTVRVTAFEVT